MFHTNQRQIEELRAENMAISKTLNLNVRRFWALIGLVWTIIGLLHYLQFYLQHVRRGNSFPWIPTLAEFIVNYSSWVPIAILIIRLGRGFRFQRSSWAKPLAVHSLASISIGIAHIGLVAAMLQTIKGPIYGFTTYRDYFVYCFLWLFHFEFLMYWVVLGLSYGSGYYSIQTGQRKQARYLDHILIKSNGQNVMLNTSKIDWLEAADNYVKVHTGSSSYLIREKMHIMEKNLDPNNFQRIHRSRIVNVSRVLELQRSKSSEWTLKLKNGQQLRVSRRRKVNLMNSLDRLT